MSNRQKDYTEQIDRYLDGEMSEEEKALFEIQVNTDKGLASDLILHQELITSLQQKEILELREKLTRISLQVKQEEEVNKRKTLRRITSLAASVTLILVVGITILTWVHKEKTSSEIFDMYYEFYEAPTDYRISESKLEIALQEAMILHNSRKFDEAFKVYSQIDDSNKVEFYIQYYKAMAYMETGISATEPDELDRNFSRAIESLLYVIDNRDNIFVLNAHWYLALCYLKLEKTNEALPHLQTLVKSEAGLHSSNANEILQQIKPL